MTNKLIAQTLCQFTSFLPRHRRESPPPKRIFLFFWQCNICFGTCTAKGKVFDKYLQPKPDGVEMLCGCGSDGGVQRPAAEVRSKYNQKKVL